MQVKTSERRPCQTGGCAVNLKTMNNTFFFFVFFVPL